MQKGKTKRNTTRRRKREKHKKEKEREKKRKRSWSGIEWISSSATSLGKSIITVRYDDHIK